MRSFYLGITIILICSACSSNSSGMRASLGPCATASRDVAVLEAEQNSITKQSNAGARAVFPIPQVAQMLPGRYSDQVAADISEYSRDINSKISDIRTNCSK